MRFGLLSLFPTVGARFVPTFSFSSTLFFATLLLFTGFAGYLPPVNTGLPTIAASLAWAALTHGRRWQQVIVTVVCPLVATLLFIAHPSTTGAAAYTFYWLLVPASFALLPRRLHAHPLTCALTASLTAHSVGTLIYLFCMPSSPALWLRLIPVVASERLRVAGMMLLIDCILSLGLYTARVVYRTATFGSAQWSKILLP